VLKALTIRDLAIVRELDVEFAEGLTVITGETGAGKSILVDALGLCLGDRADSGSVRTGAARATVSALFDLGQRPDLTAILREHDIDLTDDCVLRRVVGSDGRSRAFCNETPITLQVLREIGAELVDIHGQHAWQSLTRPEAVRELLDAYAAIDLGPLKALWADWRQSRRALDVAREKQASLQQDRAAAMADRGTGQARPAGWRVG